MRTVAVSFLAVVLAGVTHAQGNPRAVIEKAIAAHGGADKLATLSGVRLKCKGIVVINAAKIPFRADLVRRLPDKNKVVLDLELPNFELRMTQVQDGPKAWSKVEDQTEELKEERLAEQRARTHQQHVHCLMPLLDAKSFTLAPLGDVKIKDRAAVGIRVEQAGRPDIGLYFDNDSGLLLKSERRGLDPGQAEVQIETYYSEYKDFGGLKQPAKHVTHHDGRPYMELEVVEMRFEKAIDDSEFARP